MLYFVVLPTVCFSVLSVYSACCKLKKLVLLLLKDNLQTASKTPKHRIEKDRELSFAEDLKRSTLKSKKVLVFFIIFASFCFSAIHKKNAAGQFSAVTGQCHILALHSEQYISMDC